MIVVQARGRGKPLSKRKHYVRFVESLSYGKKLLNPIRPVSAPCEAPTHATLFLCYSCFSFLHSITLRDTDVMERRQRPRPQPRTDTWKCKEDRLKPKGKVYSQGHGGTHGVVQSLTVFYLHSTLQFQKLNWPQVRLACSDVDRAAWKTSLVEKLRDSWGKESASSSLSQHWSWSHRRLVIPHKSGHRVKPTVSVV